MASMDLTVRRREAPPSVLSERLRKRSLLDFDEYDPTAEVETPRSLAACLAEGIRTKDLIYVPREAFDMPDLSDEVADLRYEFFEALRQDLIGLARAAYKAILAGKTVQSNFGKGVGLEYKSVHGFFRVQLQALEAKANFGIFRTEEFKPMDMFAGSRALEGGVRSSPSSAFLQSTASKDIDPESQKAWWEYSSEDWRLPTHVDALHAMLHEAKTAPGSDWREVEAARRVEDTFGVLREMKLKARDDRHDRDNQLITKRNKGLERSFDKLQYDQMYKERGREIREHMLPPTKPNRTQAQKLAQCNRDRIMEEQEVSRREFFVHHAEKSQAIEKKVGEMRNTAAMKYAQLNTEDRVRWRHNHSAVADREKNERQGVLDNFQRRQMQLDAAGQRTADVSFMRGEINKLRDMHRKLFELRQAKKFEYDESIRHKTIRGKADKRIEESKRRQEALERKAGRKASAPPMSVDDSPPPSPGSPNYVSSAHQPVQVGLVILEEDPREQYSAAERKWMQRAVQGCGITRRSPKGFPMSASAPSLWEEPAFQLVPGPSQAALPGEAQSPLAAQE